MTYRGQRVLVTGAGGFIGSHVVEALVAAGAKVRAMVHYNSRAELGALGLVETAVRRRVAVVSGDIRDTEFVDDAVRGCQRVFHLAALISIPYSYGHVRDVVATNGLGTLNVLESARRHRVKRLVHTSTSEVYGTARQARMTESHPLQAQSPYAASKAGADLLALSYFRSFQLPVTVLRPFNTFGPRQSARAVIPTIISQLLVGRRLQVGALWPARDFTYVTDTAHAFLAAGLAPGVEGRVLHLGTGRAVSVRELITRVSRVMRVPLPRVAQHAARLRPPASEVGRLIADPRQARQWLRWRARVSLEAGIRYTVAWIRQHPEWYQWAEHFV